MSRSSPVHVVVVPSPPSRLLRWWTCAPKNEPSELAVTVPLSTMNPAGLATPLIAAPNHAPLGNVIRSVSVSWAALPVAAKPVTCMSIVPPSPVSPWQCPVAKHVFLYVITVGALDANACAVPNATIQVRNAENNEISSAKTDSSGVYTIPLLRPASYTLTVEATGFKKYPSSA